MKFVCLIRRNSATATHCFM